MVVTRPFVLSYYYNYYTVLYFSVVLETGTPCAAMRPVFDVFEVVGLCTTVT